MSKSNVPEGWGEDPLSAFIEMANQNSYGVFVNYKSWFTLFQEIDAVFEQFFEDLIDSPGFYESFLFVRAHSCFRGGVRLSTSGQLPEAYTILRGAIECALYAFHFHKNPSAVQIWLERDDSKTGKTLARNILKFGPMLTALEKDNADIGRVARHLYEFTIDAGAHPNRKAITLAMQQTQTDDFTTFTLDTLNNDEIPLVQCLKTTAQVGISVLQVFSIVFPDRYKTLDLPRQIEQLSSGL